MPTHKSNDYKVKYRKKNMKIYLRVLMKDQKNMFQKIKQEK